MSDRRVVITGVGSVTPYGVGMKRFRDSLFRGKSAASLITSFDTSRLPTRFAAPVPLVDSDLDSLIQNQKSLKTMSRAAKLGVIAADEAVKDSGLDARQVDPYRVGVSIGTSGMEFWDVEHSNQMFQRFAESLENTAAGPKVDPSKYWQNTLERTNPLLFLKTLPNMVAAHIAINHNARGNCQTIATACTSSAQAIGEAYRQIRARVSDVMICGGSDSVIHPHGLVGFSALGVMSKNNAEYRTAARPFDRRRDGLMLGEGAAIFILEEMERCKQRGARPYGEVIGYASSCDAFRVTDEPPDAWGCIEAMRSALADARLNPDDVDYINAHGTGTVMNDRTETFAIKSVFREKARSLPVSSTKSMIGHLVAASGAAELAACVLAMTDQALPPTINYESPDEECDLDYVPNQARQARVNIALSNSFGFGGQNACLLLRNAA